MPTRLLNLRCDERMFARIDAEVERRNLRARSAFLRLAIERELEAGGAVEEVAADAGVTGPPLPSAEQLHKITGLPVTVCEIKLSSGRVKLGVGGWEVS